MVDGEVSTGNLVKWSINLIKHFPELHPNQTQKSQNSFQIVLDFELREECIAYNSASPRSDADILCWSS